MMAVEHAGKMDNGIYRVRIDPAERVITVLASAGWRIEVVPTISGSLLQEVGGPVRMPPLAEQGILASTRDSRSFVCQGPRVAGVRSSS